MQCGKDNSNSINVDYNGSNSGLLTALGIAAAAGVTAIIGDTYLNNH